MVKRYKVSNGLLIVRSAEAWDTFNLKNLDVVLASDYDKIEGFLRRMLPPHIEQACDDCGGNLECCKRDYPDCPIQEARAFLTSPETEAKDG